MKKTIITTVSIAFVLIVGSLYAQTNAFPSSFAGVWKRDNYPNMLTFTANILKASNQYNNWAFKSRSGDIYTIDASRNTATLTIRLTNGNLEISGDSGSGQDNWNGIWKKVVATEADFDITQNLKGTITITGYHGAAKEVVIPEAIEGVKITEIGEKAFYGHQLISVIIPNSVTAIGANAFDENQLTSVIIGNSVTSIGKQAFCGNWDSDGNTTDGNQLTSITIPNSVEIIEEGAFRNNRLTSVSFPNSVTYIGDSAFYGNQLTNVTIPDNVTTIGANVFAGNRSNITIPDRLAFQFDDAKGIIIGYNGSGGSVTIPATINGKAVTTIGNQAFRDKRLISITIPSSVTSIGVFAFIGNHLTSIIIGNGVTSIGEGAFMGNQLITLVILNSSTTIGKGAFADSITNTLRNYNFATDETTYTYTYSDNQSLTRITLPPNITYANIFPNNFSTFYESQGRKGGIYTWSGRLWSIELPAFSSDFMGTWKRSNFNNTLTFTENTVKISSNSYTYDLVNISSDFITLKRSNSNPFTLTFRLTNGDIVISGDNGSGQDNWNGTWEKQ
jgi:hypothetical protein